VETEKERHREKKKKKEHHLVTSERDKKNHYDGRGCSRTLKRARSMSLGGRQSPAAATGVPEGAAVHGGAACFNEKGLQGGSEPGPEGAETSIELLGR
jgi:hypothetical protein